MLDTPWLARNTLLNAVGMHTDSVFVLLTELQIAA